MRGKRCKGQRIFVTEASFLLFHFPTPCLTPLRGNLKRDEMSQLYFQSFSLQGLGLQQLLVIPRLFSQDKDTGNRDK